MDILFKKINKNIIDGDIGVLEILEDDLFSKIYPDNILDDEYVIELNPEDLITYDKKMDVIIPRKTILSLRKIDSIRLSATGILDKNKEGTNSSLINKLANVGATLLQFSPDHAEEDENETDPLDNEDTEDTYSPDQGPRKKKKEKYHVILRYKLDPTKPDTEENDSNYRYRWAKHEEIKNLIPPGEHLPYKNETVEEVKDYAKKYGEEDSKFKAFDFGRKQKIGDIIAHYRRLASVNSGIDKYLEPLNPVNSAVHPKYANENPGEDVSPDILKYLMSVGHIHPHRTSLVLVNVDPARKSLGFKFEYANPGTATLYTGKHPDRQGKYYVMPHYAGWREIVPKQAAGLIRDKENLDALGTKHLYDIETKTENTGAYETSMEHILQHIRANRGKDMQGLRERQQKLHEVERDLSQGRSSPKIYKATLDDYKKYKKQLDTLHLFYLMSITGFRPGENEISVDKGKDIRGAVTLAHKNVKLSSEHDSTPRVRFNFFQKGGSEVTQDVHDRSLWNIYHDRKQLMEDRHEHLKKYGHSLKDILKRKEQKKDVPDNRHLDNPELTEHPFLSPGGKHFEHLFDEDRPLNIAHLGHAFKLDPTMTRYVLRRIRYNGEGVDLGAHKTVDQVRHIVLKDKTPINEIPDSMPQGLYEKNLATIKDLLKDRMHHSADESMESYLVPGILEEITRRFWTLAVKYLKQNNRLLKRSEVTKYLKGMK